MKAFLKVLAEQYYKSFDRWCYHCNAKTPDILGCPKCNAEHTKAYVERTRKRWANEEAVKELERAVIVDGTLKAVKIMMKQAKNLTELEEMLENWKSFKHKS